ncbi:hypothetical protein IWQ57_001136 [Coemansia nantahalensis]|uniref:Uncharacterized protein n=1 Tax=Coemansia nantahalensis TaxID=2789366 RepID=A0ACC1K5Q1_9FUNG|nr:hypothetical protein IWQ57_001136 [Coemansia nantahalensis]
MWAVARRLSEWVVTRRLREWVVALPGERGRRGLRLPRTPWDYLQRMQGAQRYKGDKDLQPPMLVWAVFSGVTSFVAIAVLGMVQKYGPAIRDHHLPFAIAPAGATVVLVFAVPAAPLAQPRNVVGGHLIAAIIGTFMHALFANVADSFRWMPAALAVGISIGLMGLTNCYHPPAGATAFIAGFFAADIERVNWWFPLYPVLPVSLILVGLGVLLNNICRVYPTYWFTPAPRHKAAVPPSPPILPPSSPFKPCDSIPLTGESGHTLDPHIQSSGDAQPRESPVNGGAADEAELVWLRARVHELEQEVSELRGGSA